MNANRQWYAIRILVWAAVLAGTASLTVSPAVAYELIAQDLNHDTAVDRHDLALFWGCISGDGVSHDGSSTCAYADTDQDGDVDMADFGVMQVCFSGLANPADPACGGCAMPDDSLWVDVSSEAVPIGFSSDLVVHDSQVGANYQLRDDADGSPVGDPVAGNDGTILLPTGPLNEDTTFNVLAINAMWGCSVELSTTKTVTVFPYQDNNKIGVHVVWGSRNGYGPFLADCAAAGKPVAVVKCVDGYDPAQEAKQYHQDTLTVGRQNEVGDHNLQGLDELVGSMTPVEAAAWYYDIVKPIWQSHDQYIDVWETCNEWSWHWAWQADFYIAFMDIAEADGFRLALWSCSVGNPPEEYYWDIARTCLRAKTSGNHILSLHEYAFSTTLLQDAPTTLVTRYRTLYDYLATQNAVIPLALTEVGQGGGYEFVGTTLFVDDFGWYDTQMRQDWYVIGCAAWTLGNWNNGQVNFQDALPALTQYIISH